MQKTKGSTEKVPFYGRLKAVWSKLAFFALPPASDKKVLDMQWLAPYLSLMLSAKALNAAGG